MAGLEQCEYPGAHAGGVGYAAGAAGGDGWLDYAGAFREHTEEQLGNLMLQPGEYVTMKSAYQTRVDTEELGRLSDLMADAGVNYWDGLTQSALTLAETSMLWSRISTEAARAEEMLAQAVRELRDLWTDGPEYSIKLQTARHSYEAAELYAKGLSEGFEMLYAGAGRATLTAFTATPGLGVVAGLGVMGLMAADAHLRGSSRAAGTFIGALSGASVGRGAIDGDLPLLGTLQSRAELQMRRRGYGLARLEGFRRVEDTHPAMAEVQFAGVAQPSTEFLARQIEVGGQLDTAHDRTLGEDQSQVHDGVITVQKIAQGDGTYSFVVTVPGTDFDTIEGFDLANGMAGPNSFGTMVDNFAADPDASLEESSALVQMIDRALQDAGAGLDTPVVLAGFSQGGMGVMSAVGTRAFTNRYNVTGVMTFGAPTQQYRNVPDSVAVTHLKDVNDVVTTDVPGQAHDDRAEVIRFGSEHRGLGIGAHSAENYREAAAMIDPQLGQTADGRRFQSALEESLPAGAAVETRVYAANAEFVNRPRPEGR